MLTKILFSALAGAAVLLALTHAEDQGPNQGKDLFIRRCSGCHATEINKEGPKLRGVYGRKAGTVADFTYSDAVKKLNIRWDDASLDKWLTDPDAMARDTDMAFRLANADERKAVIAYLKSLGN
jgi:cytochrome c